MKHLAILERAELIVVGRRGRERWNYLNAIPLQRIYERWLRPYEAEWASALLQLKRHIEKPKGTEAQMGEQVISTATLSELHIEQNITIEASPGRVFQALTEGISSWWTAPFFHTQGARRIVLEPRVGGRLYEDIGDEQGTLLGIVTFIKRPEELRITGSMFMATPVQGVIIFQLEPKAESTLLRLSHRMVGEIDEEAGKAIHGGWHELLQVRLRNFVEKGTRYDLLHQPAE
jgi:uncharacterized protein YndB with AHSA1/START domain